MTVLHEALDDTLRERAALFALGALDAGERASFEEHAGQCPACADEVASLMRVTHAMSELVPPVAPADDLRERLMSRIRRTSPAPQPWKAWASGSVDGFAFVPGKEGAWEAGGVPGVTVRRLFVDAASDRVTMLVRMEAGTSYPAHEHAGIEECYVLEGDLRVGELHMKSGDYQRADRGSVHVSQSTDAGCLLFIVSSLHDEMISI